VRVWTAFIWQKISFSCDPWWTRLTIQSLAVTLRTIIFNVLKLCLLPTEFIRVFHMVLKIKTDSFPKQHYYFLLFSVGWDLCPFRTAVTTVLLYQPQIIDYGNCGATGGIKTGRGNRSTRRKPVPALIWPPQIPHDQTQARIRATVVGNSDLKSVNLLIFAGETYCFSCEVGTAFLCSI
jgi:hypothetical protein